MLNGLAVLTLRCFSQRVIPAKTGIHWMPGQARHDVQAEHIPQDDSVLADRQGDMAVVGVVE